MEGESELPDMSEFIGPYRVGPNDDENCGIYTGDARELSKTIPNESVDLIFTDPVYDRFADYQWLVCEGQRILVCGGNLVSFVSPDMQVKIANLFIEQGFTWCDYLILRETARRRMNHGRKIIGLYEVATWASNGKGRIGKYVNNFSFVSNGYIKTDQHHGWEKELRGILHWIDRLSTLVVFDPFVGGGTSAVACKTLGRRYLAFEIDPSVAERARKRVRLAQLPLFVSQPDQMELSL